MLDRCPNRRDAVLGLSALIPAGIAGCTVTPVRTVTAPNFSNLTPLNLNVADITVELLHDNRQAYPHIEGLSPYPLNNIIQRWLNDTVNTVGSTGQLTVQIIEASLIEEKLKKKPGLTGLFSINQTETYHGNIQLRFLVTYPEFTGEIGIASNASRSVNENVTLRDRQQDWVNLGEKMVIDIDHKLRQSIEQELPRLFLAS